MWGGSVDELRGGRERRNRCGRRGEPKQSGVASRPGPLSLGEGAPRAQSSSSLEMVSSLALHTSFLRSFVRFEAGRGSCVSFHATVGARFKGRGAPTRVRGERAPRVGSTATMKNTPASLSSLLTP